MLQLDRRTKYVLWDQHTDRVASNLPKELSTHRQKMLQLSTQPIFIIDLIHSLNIPYSQVELVLANGQSVDLFYTVQENDRISVYPQFHSIELASIH